MDVISPNPKIAWNDNSMSPPIDNRIIKDGTKIIRVNKKVVY